jgi:hypothetical protein
VVEIVVAVEVATVVEVHLVVDPVDHLVAVVIAVVEAVPVEHLVVEEAAAEEEPEPNVYGMKATLMLPMMRSQ